MLWFASHLSRDVAVVSLIRFSVGFGFQGFSTIHGGGESKGF
jgi:hypothetical protein